MSLAPFPKNPRKALRQHRNTRRLIGHFSDNGDGTTAVVYLDPIEGQADAEIIPSGDCIRVPNSLHASVKGDWMLDGPTHLFRVGSKAGTRLDISRMSDQSAEWIAANYWQGGMVQGGFLGFADFDAMAAWTARKGIAPKGWTVDWFGAWVPVGDRRARYGTTMRPCADSGCNRPCKDDLSLCAIHANAEAKRQASNERWAAESAARRERWSEQQRSRQVAEMWADRIRSDFNIKATANDNGVVMNGEGLHGLLAAVSVELRELGINLDDLIGRELRIDDTVES